MVNKLQAYSKQSAVSERHAANRIPCAMSQTSRRRFAARLLTATCLIGAAGLPASTLAQTYGLDGENGVQRAGGAGFGQGLYPGGGGPIQSDVGGEGNGGGGNGGGAGFARGTSGGGGGGVGSGGGGGAGVRGNAQGVGEDASGSNGGLGGNGVVGMGAGRGGGGGGGGGTAFVPVGITTVTQSYIGGQGGAGTSASLGAAGGGGGGGGIGLLADSIMTLSVSAGNSVIGGTGGNGGNGSAFSSYAGGGGGGGAGGYGMYLQSTNLTNSGTIQGGNGGLGGLGATGDDGASAPGAAGAGGAGLVVGPGGGLIDNAGTIAGGFTGGHAGDEAYRASAIVIAGGTADLIFTDAAAVLLGGIELQNDGELRLGSAGIMATFANTISGQGRVSKFGTTTLTLTGVNTYTGGTLVAGGVLAVTEDANLGDASGGVTLDGGTLQVAGAANIATARAFTIGASGGTLDTNGFNLTIDSGIAGTGGLTKVGVGVLTLTGVSDYTGATSINGGRLLLAEDFVLSDLTAVSIVSGATLEIDTDVSAAIGSLAGAGSVVIGAGSVLYVGGDGTSRTFSGDITGGGSLEKELPGTLTLTGISSIGGDLTVCCGVIDINGTGSFTTGGDAVVEDGALNVTAGGTLSTSNLLVAAEMLVDGAESEVTASGISNIGLFSTASLTISDGGVVNSQGGAVILAFSDISTVLVTGTGSAWNVDGGLMIGDDSFGPGSLTIADGGVVDSSGTTEVDGDSFLYLGAGALAGEIQTAAIANDGAIVADFTDTLELDADISGSGTLDKAGIGTLILSGTDSYTGLTTVTDGTLRVNGSLAGAVTAQTGAILAGIGSIAGAVTVADGATLAPGNSPGTLTVGSLLLNDASKLAFEFDTPGVIGGGVNDLVVVTGGLTLDGQLTIAPLTDFGTGSYRLFNYGSLAADNGLVIVSGPAGYNFEVATGANEVNLIVNYVGLQFWNGGTLAADGTVHGGPGTWNNADTNWTDANGDLTQDWAGLTAVFAGLGGGTVTVSENVAVAGLQFGLNGYELTGPGKIVVSAADTEVRVDAGITATIGAEITGAGGLFKTSDGTLILSGTNSYLGGTTLAAGTLQISADGNLGALAGGLTFTGGTLATTASFNMARGVTLASNGTLDVATGTVLGLTGVVTGAGGLAKQGFGTLVLAGANNYAGGTLFDDGILQVSSDANLGTASGGLSFAGGMLGTTASFASSRDVAVPTLGGLDIAAGTELDLSGAISGAGTLAKSGTGALVLSGTSSVDWNIQAGSLTAQATNFTGDASIGMGAAFTLNADAAASYAGTLSGFGSFTKTGAASLNYTGDGLAFSGVTTIAAGRLAVNGSLGGAVEVLSGGVLGGSGTTGPVTLANGAVIAPGNSAGTLTINGDITFASGSTYQAELAGNGTSDLISATGQAFLNGAGLSLIALDPGVSYQNGQSYVILEAASGVVGSFGNVTTDSIFLAASTVQQNGEVSVTVTVTNDPPGPPAPPTVFTTAAVTPNQFAVASALDTLPQSGASLGLYNALLFLTSEAEAQSAFDQLSGEAYASAKGMFMEQSALLRTAMIDRLRASFGAVAASSAPVMAYAAPTGPAASEAGMALKATVAPAVTEKLALWTSGFGSWGEMAGNGNAASLSSSNGGFLIGADATLGAGWRLGITGGYSYTDFDVDSRNSSGDSENWHIGLYGGNQWGPLGLRTGLAYTFHDVEMSRAVGFTGFSDALSSDYDAGTFQAFGELGYRIDTAFAAFEPFANLAYVSLHTDGFTEDGGAAALAGSSSTTDTSFTTLGLRASKTVLIGNAETTLRGALSWRHAFGDVTPLATQAFAGSEAFTGAGTPIAEDAALIEAGFDVLVSDSTTLGVAYSGQFGDGVTQNGFNATLKVTF